MKPELKLKKVPAPLPEAKVAVRAKTRTLTELIGIANYKGPTITLQQMKGMRRAKVADELGPES